MGLRNLCWRSCSSRGHVSWLTPRLDPTVWSSLPSLVLEGPSPQLEQVQGWDLERGRWYWAHLGCTQDWSPWMPLCKPLSFWHVAVAVITCLAVPTTGLLDKFPCLLATATYQSGVVSLFLLSLLPCFPANYKFHSRTSFGVEQCHCKLFKNCMLFMWAISINMYHTRY